MYQERSANVVQLRPPFVFEARKAWFDARYDDCLEQLDAIAPRNTSEKLDETLLRARVFMRKLDFVAAHAELERAERYARSNAGAMDAGRTLQGILAVRRGARSTGMALLDTPLNGGLPRIAAQRAYYRAFAFWLARELDEAEKALGPALDPRNALYYARGLAMRGRIESSRGHYAAAARTFLSALRTLRAATEGDRHLQATMLRAAAELSVELLDLNLASAAEREWDRMRWPADLAGIHSQVLSARAIHAAVAGDATRAWTQLWDAGRVAPRGIHRLQAHVAFAHLMRSKGDRFAPRQHLSKARQEIGNVQWSVSNLPSRFALLEYAIEAARLADHSASHALMRFFTTSRSNDTMRAHAVDPRAIALERQACALVANHGREKNVALALAAEKWRRLGFRLRYAEALLDANGEGTGCRVGWRSESLASGER